LAITTALLTAQSEAKRAFEVASVKPSTPRFPGRAFLPGGRFTATNLPLRALIQVAYDVPPILISGGPKWVDSESYDIDAKADDPATKSDQLRQMLQVLLADRFQLILRRETKELPVYALVVSKGGPKLKKAEERECPDVFGMEALASNTICHFLIGGPGTGLTGNTVNMRDLADALTVRLRQPVLDMTGIEGSFDIKTTGWNPGLSAPGTEPSADPNGASLFAVLQEQLGLRLDSRKAPVGTLVIERAERPAGN
jgi:uncharacterized protein (TIGR03435 family)